MKQWPTKPLGEICSINPRFLKTAVPTMDAAVTFVPMKAIDEVTGTIAWPELRQYRSIAKGYTQFKKNDVLLAKITPCMENGKAAIARNLSDDFGVGSTEFHIIRPTETVLPEWVWFFIRQPSFRSAAAANFTGSAGQRRVPASFLKETQIPVPPVSEQKRILKFLSEANELRKLRAKSDDRTEALIPALFVEMFGDPAVNPYGWPRKRLGELMTSCDYGTSQKANQDGHGIPVLRMGNVTTNGRLDLTDMKAVVLSDAELARQQLRTGDVLFNRTNSRELVGKTGMWDGRYEAVAASYFIRVRFRPDVERPEHFTTFMNLPIMKQRLAEMARGAIGQSNINSKELQAIELPLPPLSLQNEFAKRIVEIYELEAEQTASRQRLDDLFQSTLYRAFSGPKI